MKEEVRVPESYVRIYLEPPENRTLLTFLNTPGKKLVSNVSSTSLLLTDRFSEGDIGTTLYEWHSPISSKKLDFGTYHEKVLNLEERKSDNEDEPCVDSSHETIYYKVLKLHRNKVLLGFLSITMFLAVSKRKGNRRLHVLSIEALLRYE